MRERNYRINGEILSERMGEEMVLVDPVSGQYFQLNEVATRMLELLLTETKQGDIVDAIREEFDASPEQVRTDLESFMQSLGDKGLLEFS